MDETWAKLSHNIVEIQNHRAANLSFEENHRYAYNMVLYKNGERLYKGTTQLVAENLDKLAREYIIPAFPTNVSEDPVQKSQEGATLLKALKKVWEDHTSSLSKLQDVLRYMVSLSDAPTSQYTHLAFRHVSRIAYTPAACKCLRYGMPA